MMAAALRERELETLRAGRGRARAGEGMLLLIEVPAGVGKTVLARGARLGRGSAFRGTWATPAVTVGAIRRYQACGHIRQRMKGAPGTGSADEGGR